MKKLHDVSPNQNFKGKYKLQFLGTKLTHCAMHNTMYNKYQEEKKTVSKRKKGGSCFLNIYTGYFSIILGPGGKINTPFCGKKVDTNTKKCQN